MNTPTASAVTWSMTGGTPARPVRHLSCELCGSKFTTTSNRARFCSDACRIDSHKKANNPRASKTCQCGSKFAPTWPNQRFCTVDCRLKTGGRPVRKRVMDGGVRRDYGRADLMDACPDDVDGVAPWVASAAWGSVERVWVGLFVEQFANDGNRAAMARALTNIRKRYRSRSGVAAPQAVE